MRFVEFFFWLSAGCVVYAYIGYPLLLVVSGFFNRRYPCRGPFTGSVSIVLVVRNEEAILERRLRELVDLIKAGPIAGEIVVVSDGSTDRTASIACAFATEGPVRFLESPLQVGKAAALTLGCQSCRSDVLVFADARQSWAPDALAKLLENFADPRIGAVSGELELKTTSGVMAGIGLYWRYEKWLRRMESGLHSQVGATGAISGVRRELFRPIPPGTLLDDVYWPLQVAMQGYRVVHDRHARAYDRLPAKSRDEFRRKVRTLAGNFQLVTRLPTCLLPWRNPVWLQFVSHKLLRLVVPWALLILLPTSFLLEGWGYQAVFWSQVGGYGLALVGLTAIPRRFVPLAGPAASVLVLNAAAFCAFWVWLSGRAGQSWQKISYPTN
jgi:biofilm PGA synthesis N-glycosyltransferase PgaC